MKVSYSRLSTYLGCPYQHYLSYVKRLRQRKVVRPLHFGSDFHALLQHRHSVKDLTKAQTKIGKVWQDLSPQVQEELGVDYLSDLLTVFNDYQHCWAGSEVPIRTEHEFKILVGRVRGEEVYFHGIIDEVYPNNILGEHKTFGYQVPPTFLLTMSPQTNLYAKAHELETGEIPTATRWDYIKSAPSSYPLWLEKSGRFSEAANSKITPMSWERACAERGVTDEGIINKRDLYASNISNYFFRCETPIILEAVESCWSDFKVVVKDIAVRGGVNKVKNVSKDCGWCGFKPICHSELTGGPTEYIIETEFCVREEN